MTTNQNLLGAVPLGVVAPMLNESMNVVKGDTATLIEKPEGMNYLMLKAHVGDWFIKGGDYSGDGDPVPVFPSTPSATDQAGDTYHPMTEGERIVLSAPSALTVKGEDTNAFLYYYWFQ
jgi:hypothetical protein